MADPMGWLSGKERNSAVGSSSSSSLIDAKLEEHQIGGTKPCPRCGFKLDSKEGIQDWPGLPAGVKFDPTDQELLEHLEAKAEICGTKPHSLIDEFIPTLEGEDGICYTHPEKLPGVTRDGLNRHFFHRPSKAYTTGTRKRRKIQGECDLQGGETRWHKTGKTRPVIVNGKQKGCKKILVLYTNFGKHRKPEKTNWVMHQYHLGLQEEEKDGELVVSKVFYQTQPRQCNWERNANDLVEGNKSQEIMTTDMFRPADHIGRVKSLYLANNTPPGLAAVATPSVAYNVVGDVQEVKTDQFSHARTSFDEGISDSGKGSESSHCTPRSCDEHEEHEQQQKKKNLHDDTAQGFRMTRHDISSIMRLNNNSSTNNNNNSNNNNIRSDANVEHKASFHSHPPPSPLHHHRSSTPDMACRAGESQDPEIHEDDLVALEDKLVSNEKIQTTRQPKTGSRSSLNKLSLDDIFIDPSEMKEVTAVPFANSQETEWFKYGAFWTESDSLENQKMI